MKYLRTRSSLSILALFSTFSMAGSGQADPTAELGTTHVVELFTSQGCSSCPPANRTAVKAAQQPGILALSYGVTYWDYLGWKDTFGDAKFTQRQRGYQKALDSSNMYTPQIVLNGAVHSPSYSQDDIRSMALPDTNYTADITLQKDKFVISSNAPLGSKIAFISYLPGEQDVEVKGGENGGQTLKLVNVVTDIVKSDWAGDSLVLKVSPVDGQAYAALVHDQDRAKIIAVATYTP